MIANLHLSIIMTTDVIVKKPGATNIEDFLKSLRRAGIDSAAPLIVRENPTSKTWR